MPLMTASAAGAHPRRIYDFMGKQKITTTISLLMFLAAAVVIWTHGINKGVDFLGGLKLSYQITSPGRVVSDGDVTATLAHMKIAAQIQQFGDAASQRFLIKIKQGEQNGAAAGSDGVAPITAALTAAFGDGVKLEAQEMVGPRVGRELNIAGQKTILFVVLALLLYVGFRFDFYFAPGAIIALIHDVFITLGFLVFMGVEYNLTILAALLTLAGYSMNDTIIIYDRIRERSKEMTAQNIESVVNRSLTETLSRTIVTHLTVFISVCVLYAIAHGDIRDFALAFVFGVVTGTYSSIYVASPIYIYAFKRWPQK